MMHFLILQVFSGYPHIDIVEATHQIDIPHGRRWFRWNTPPHDGTTLVVSVPRAKLPL